MKTLIAVSSKTDNTRKIAEAIHAALPEAELHNVENAPSPAAFDLIFVGFWVDKGTADKKAKEYIQQIKNKAVAIFGTLGAYPDSQHAVNSLENAAQLLPDCQVVGRYICQGAISPELIERLKRLPAEHSHAPNDTNRKRWKDASMHPDIADCQAAANWAVSVVKKLQ
ncbi:flavodoxin family protein [Dehalococcoidia bacterium]|nr:flavodoxin family protein [Dehalococcoidia bacterium]